jgi:hypothetical protein
MFLRSVLLGATALSAGVSAMLVIPEMESKVEVVDDGFLNVHPMLVQEAQHALIELPCTECPFRQMADNGELSWTDGHSSSLVWPPPPPLMAFLTNLLPCLDPGLFDRRQRFAGQRSPDLPARSAQPHHRRPGA